MSKAEQMAKEKPEIREVLDALMELFTEHNGCCYEIGTLFNQIREKNQPAGAERLSESGLEAKTRSLKSQLVRESSICYRMGLNYNELRQLLGSEEAEALIEEDPKLSFTDVVLYGKVAERFSQPHAVAYGIHKMVQLVDYGELTGMTFGDADPGASQISLIQEGGRWKKCAFRNCSADELEQTVVAIKAQRGIPIEKDFDDFDLD
jgi:hypothetical protein